MPKKAFPWWIWLIAALVLLAIVGGIVWAVSKGGREAPRPEPTTSVSASPTPDPVPQAGAAWFQGRWIGTIDGRPAAMNWYNDGTANSPRFRGEFSDGNSGNYVPLTYSSHNVDEIYLRHSDGNTWFLRREHDNFARGWTTWQGRQFPLVMERISR